MIVIWSMVPKIWSAMDRIFCHFWSFFAFLPTFTTQKIKILKNWKIAKIYHYFTHVYHKWKSYDVWFLRKQAQQTDFFVILDHFLPFYPPNNPKNQNFEKKWKNYQDILSFYICAP